MGSKELKRLDHQIVNGLKELFEEGECGCVVEGEGWNELEETCELVEHEVGDFKAQDDREQLQALVYLSLYYGSHSLGYY